MEAASDAAGEDDAFHVRGIVRLGGLGVMPLVVGVR
jgi:hypothetical protein